jgi:hypothetical protein
MIERKVNAHSSNLAETFGKRATVVHKSTSAIDIRSAMQTLSRTGLSYRMRFLSHRASLQIRSRTLLNNN